jgi:hypothetical protein
MYLVDHVAMVLKFEAQDSLCLIETTGSSGVKIIKWIDMKKHFG